MSTEAEAPSGDCGSGAVCPDDLAGAVERCGRILIYGLGRWRGQARILQLLQERDGTSQKELQEQLGIQPGSMSEIAAKLEGKGLILRQRDEADRRKILLSITAQGREWLSRQDEAHIRQRRAALFSTLTETEQSYLRDVLDKLAADWERRFEGGRR